MPIEDIGGFALEGENRLTFLWCDSAELDATQPVRDRPGDEYVCGLGAATGFNLDQDKAVSNRVIFADASNL